MKVLFRIICVIACTAVLIYGVSFNVGMPDEGGKMHPNSEEKK